MSTRCSIALLESALTGNLPAADETSLHRHLEECEQCSAALERMAGGAAWCQEAASLLSEDELDAAMPTHEEWSEVDFTVEHLEPADEPNVLGRLGSYDVLQIIGHGGMGVVLKAYDRELKRCVAIKVLAPHLAQSSLAKKRFAREAQAAAAVVHPNVLAIHHVHPGGRLPFLVMPLVAGESLAERLAAQGPLELKEILRIGMQAAAGLAAAHEQGLVHRDVKPANILLEKGVERAVLTDFGLARAADDVALTRWGIIAGTPEYMSPEQARGEPLDGRSDLFSLGCVLYEMATGVSPFRADSLLATMRRLVDVAPQALVALHPELPPWFIALVDRLLEKDPSRRFNSAREVSELLEGCLAHVQQPASVPLPAALPMPAPRRAWLPFNLSLKGVLAMISVSILLLFGMFLLSATPSDIAGQWSGEEWGQVVLKKTSDGEYAGTYTDTFGKQPGEIQLKWSRLERRFYGTWREGEDRFGELSVRLVGDEIRGAHTTDPKARINPATPRLADLLWVRGNADSHWAFGPEINRTLISSGGNLSNDALRLDDGHMFGLPKKSTSREESNKDMSHEEQEKWLNQIRVNFAIDYLENTDQWEMKLRNLKFAEISDENWKTLSAHELQERFSKLKWKEPMNASTDQKERGFYSLIFTRGMTPPMTFAFETSDGHRGILQFLGSNHKGTYDEALIRYKQIQQPDPPAKELGAFSHRVPFEVGATYLRGGDRITIDEVRGTADTIKSGNLYEIKGTYRLASQGKATLGVYITDDGTDATAARLRDVPTQKTQSMAVERGEGKFSLIFYVWHDGKPHVSLYSESGEGFGHVYFGTGDSVLKKGWWEAPGSREASQFKGASFGPVFERDVRNREAIDFDTGNLAMIPDAELNPEKGLLWILEQRLGSLTVWMDEQRMDALSEGDSLTAFGLKVNELTNADWNTMDPSELVDALKLDWQKVNPRQFGKAIRPIDPQARPHVILSQRGRLRTLAFQTREGGMGILQIIETTNAGLKARFKLLNPVVAKEPRVLVGHTDWVTGVAFSPDGKRVASSSRDGTLKLWDADAGRELLTLKRTANDINDGHHGYVQAVAFSPDGKYLASAGSDKTVYVWNAASGRALAGLTMHTSGVMSVAYSLDGARLASASSDNTVKVWDPNPAAGKFGVILSLEHPMALSVSFSRDQKRLASAGRDNLIRLWDPISGELQLTMTHTDQVTCVAFSPDGTRLASAGPAGVQVWDASTGKLVFTLKGLTGISGVKYSPDGKRLASSGGDHQIKLWDATTGQELLTLKGHGNSVGSMAFSPDGKRLASASSDRTVRVWNVTSPDHERSAQPTELKTGAAAERPAVRNAVSGTTPKCLHSFSTMANVSRCSAANNRSGSSKQKPAS